MKKHLLTFTLALSILLTALAPIAFADEYAILTTNIDYSQNITPAPSAAYLGDGNYTEDENLKAPDLSKAGAAILIDRKTCRVLYGKKANERMYPASTTKIMTGVLALELLAEKGYRMSDVIEAQTEAIIPITSDDSHMGILIGEELTVENLIYGLLVYSANDAANVLAVELAGSMDNFVKLMNDKAASLGMAGTRFVNVCGVHDDSHYTTPYDLAVLARYAMQNETFAEIVKTPMYKMSPTNKYKEERDLSNTNLFLSTYRSSYYKDTDHYFGIKTGHTDMAGYCLVTNARLKPDDGEEIDLISVVMGCHDTDVNYGADSYVATTNLVNYGFNNYKYTTVQRAGDILKEIDLSDARNKASAKLTTDSDVYALLPKNISLENIDVKYKMTTTDAPVDKGEKLGTAEFVWSEHTITTCSVLSANDVKLNIPLRIYHVVQRFIKRPAVIIIFTVLLILYLIATAIRKRNERKKRLRRLRRVRQNSDTQTTIARRMQQKSAFSGERNANSMYSTKKDSKK